MPNYLTLTRTNGHPIMITVDRVLAWEAKHEADEPHTLIHPDASDSSIEVRESLNEIRRLLGVRW